MDYFVKLKSELGSVNIVESVSDLPSPHGEKVYLDFETNGLYPYIGHRACGVAVLFGNDSESYYVPYRHTRDRWNLPLENVLPWLKDVLSAPIWVNHNIKFDAHMAFVDGVEFKGEFQDTMTAVKMHSTDRFTYGLKQVCAEFFNLDATEQDKVKQYLLEAKSKNYADVPADIMGRYAGDDVFMVRKLMDWLDKHRPESTKKVWETEKKMTRVFYEMEKKGMRVDKVQVQKEKLRTLRKTIKSAEIIEGIIKRQYTSSSKCHFEVLHGMFNLPVLKWNTDNGTTTPCFDKEAMNLYSIHPQVLANPKILELIQNIEVYRKEAGFQSRYLEPYLTLADDRGYIHPTYNQIVRTGRTSCSKPNFQGVSPRGRELILPSEGKVFYSADASQIEFRILIHYMKDNAAIAAYKENPNTDFHQWVADMCSDIGLKRGQAKGMNFAIGYGAGKRKVVAMLSGNPDVMEEIGAKIALMDIPDAKRASLYEEMCYQRASKLYQTYHDRFAVKKISNTAAKNARIRGYVFNLHGRRRHLPVAFARNALNTVVQGEAMDYIKERMVEIHYSDLPFDMLANVHDEILSEGEKDLPTDELNKKLCETFVDYRLPMAWDIGIGSNWRIAAGK